MNKKDVLIDFSIHLLLLGDEFRNDELQFFNKRPKNETSYVDYLNAMNKFVDVEEFIWDTDVYKPFSKINTLNALITEKEIAFFQEYINKEFSFGYPNEVDEEDLAYGHYYSLDLTIGDIKSYFEDYIELRKSNPLHYLTYYQQFLNYLSDQSRNTIESTKSNIDNFYNSKSSIDIGVYSNLKDKLKSQLQENLLKCTQDTPFQIQGGFDKYGFILNYKDTLKVILNFYNSKYSKLNLEVDLKQYYALIEYEYFLFKIEGKQTTTITEEQKKLKDQFEDLKKNNQKQVQFLKNKDFDNSEIEIILNCFSLNHFNTCGIRNIRNISKVDFFGLFYFFYRFEFLDKTKDLSFEDEKDFLALALIGNINKNDFKKYYEHSNDTVMHNQNPHKRYPFKKVEKLLTKIESELHIDLKKLNIPPQLRKPL